MPLINDTYCIVNINKQSSLIWRRNSHCLVKTSSYKVPVSGQLGHLLAVKGELIIEASESSQHPARLVGITYSLCSSIRKLTKERLDEVNVHREQLHINFAV